VSPVSSSRTLSAVVIALLAAAVLPASGTAAADPAARPTAPSAERTPSALAVAGRGATVPFAEQEAENAATNGSVVGPDRKAGTLAGEASGRTAVTLTQGQYVEFTLGAPANAIDVRYSLPDNAEGTGVDSSIALYVDGAKNRDLALTSRYGWYYGSYPFTNRPGDGKAHHFYDEARALLGGTLAEGTKVRLQLDGGGPATTVDLADFEQVAGPAGQPANSVSVTDHGATPGDGSDDAAAFDAAIADARAQGEEVWVPAGVFTLNRHVTVDHITIRGAGMWHTELRGARPGLFGKGEPASCGHDGYPGNPEVPGVSEAVALHDFAIIGNVTERVDCDQTNAVGGALGGGSVVSGLWLQHTKVGLWLDGPFDGLTVSGNRILDQTADGLNLHRGVTGTTVTNNFVRNSGDDGLAMWSETQPDRDNTFSHNTVIAPILANSIAIYGGSDISVTDNVVAETQDQGGGIHIANRFSAVPLGGTTTVARNTAIRSGVLDSNWQFGVGALWFDGRDSPLTGRIDVSDMDIVDSNYEAIQFINGATDDVHFDGVRITGAGTFAFQFQTRATGTIRDVVATGIGVAGIYNCLGPDVPAGLADQGGNSGFTTTFCGSWPPPVYGGDNGGGDPAEPPADANLALHAQASTTGSQGGFPAGNAVDGNADSYWESVNNAFPQSLTVDLGATRTVGRLVLRLPPSPAWGTRTQTIAVQASVDGSAWTTVRPAAGYAFDPATGNTATITFAPTEQRHLRLLVTGNTGWPAGQMSEFEAYRS
jgi:alpha-1,3-glucanase-like protein/F5/8 type C domain-containing protein